MKNCSLNNKIQLLETKLTTIISKNYILFERILPTHVSVIDKNYLHNPIAKLPDREISKSTRISHKSIQADHSTGGKVPLMRATLRPIN